MAENTGQPPRLFASLRQLARTALAMAHTRLALAGVELEEELQRLIGLLLNLLGLLVFGLAGILIFTLMLVLAADVSQRVAVLAFFAALYLGLGGWFWWRIRRVLATRPPFLQATLAEMAQDRDTLQAASASSAQQVKDGHE
ncbi:MAG: phage holin family protein [Polaromonas sp.]|uniref:phage holin family protein n=1 Tax=Polaromonas sp. TaxID=1869339 RepID=UPI00272F83CE|nr:phage holin family protein [Polaromonas sp.]MDP1741440.1 phage holin family protein [Polaromonas sp.]MDP1956299.1 phage holin family protein [Polaromonas sp.]MDP3354731.1 phage holin family protein [Polaromonas sp.]MDP3752171.1 phage holin family protein [Polaromonas sp.]